VETRDQVQVLKEISPGDMEATVGRYGLPNGCPVKIVPDLTAGHASDTLRKSKEFELKGKR
jgi:hypothetical protein